MEEKQEISVASDTSLAVVVEQLQLTCLELRKAIDIIKDPNDQFLTTETEIVDDLIYKFKGHSEMHANAIARIGEWIAGNAVRSIGERVGAMDNLVVEMHNHIATARERKLQNFCLFAIGGVGVAVGILTALLLPFLFP